MVIFQFDLFNVHISGCSSNTWIGRGECTSGSVDSFRDELLADQQEAEVQVHQGWEKR